MLIKKSDYINQLTTNFKQVQSVIWTLERQLLKMKIAHIQVIYET